MSRKALTTGLFLVSLFCVSCGVFSGSSGEEWGTPTSPFEGEHENLRSGDTAVWREGLEMSIYDVHIAPNQSRLIAEKSRKAQEARGNESEESPSENAPAELVVFGWTITNNEQLPVKFNGSLPCEALDPNGVRLPPSGGFAEEQNKTIQTRPLEQPMEPGQTREGVESLSPPVEGTTFEIVCAHPPQQGGKPSIAQLADQAKVSWSIDISGQEPRE